jgi:Fuc2NAc and GlcNAc transferase
MEAVLYGASILLGGLGAWGVARFGGRFGLIAAPNERSSHRRPTPKGGGIGILATFAAASLALGVAASLLFAGVVLALVSLLVDRRDIAPGARLLLQFVAALGFLLPLLNAHPDRMIALGLLPVLAVFMVGTANFYNFMDGINGIAAITGLVAFGLLGLAAHELGAGQPYAPLAVCMALSCLGFLPFNIPRARVFMGDVGSILLGFVFAGMVVLLAAGFTDFISLAALLFPFYADELTTMAVRLRSGERLTEAHRRHLYQILANEYGISHWKVSLGFGLLQLAVAAAVWLVRPYGGLAVVALLGGCFGGFALASGWIRQRAVNSEQ